MRSNRRQSGFTLLEVTIAVSILAIIMGITYSSLNQIIRSKKILDDKRDTGIIANSILTRMTRELQLAMAEIQIMSDPTTGSEPDPNAGMSLLGEPQSIGEGASGDKLTWMALEGGQYLPDGGTHSGVVQITYRVEKNPEADSVNKDLYYLVRDEVPFIRPVKRAYEKRMTFPITKNLVSLEFRYYDARNKEWVSEWKDSSRPKLPKMVKLLVKIKSPQGSIESYSTVVALRSKN